MFVYYTAEPDWEGDAVQSTLYDRIGALTYSFGVNARRPWPMEPKTLPHEVMLNNFYGWS